MKEPARILVVEDDPVIAEGLQALLALHGYEVRDAASVDRAVEAAREFRPHAVVCDLSLGAGGDGRDVAIALRTDPALSAIRRLALSGMGDERRRREALRAGFEEVLLKPVEPDHLLARIATLLAGRE